jgi:hypothetical protein
MAQMGCVFDKVAGISLSPMVLAYELLFHQCTKLICHWGLAQQTHFTPEYQENVSLDSKD